MDQRKVAFGAYVMKMALTLGQHHLLKSPFFRLMAHISKRNPSLNCNPNCHSLLQAQIIKTWWLALSPMILHHISSCVSVQPPLIAILTFQLDQGTWPRSNQVGQDGTFVVCVSTIYTANG